MRENKYVTKQPGVCGWVVEVQFKVGWRIQSCSEYLQQLVQLLVYSGAVGSCVAARQDAATQLSTMKRLTTTTTTPNTTTTTTTTNYGNGTLKTNNFG